MFTNGRLLSTSLLRFFTRTTSKDDTRGLATTSGPYPAADVSLFHLYTGKAICLHQGHFRTTSTSNEVKRLPLGCHHRKKRCLIESGPTVSQAAGCGQERRQTWPWDVGRAARALTHICDVWDRTRASETPAPGRGPDLDLPAGFVLGSRRLGPRSIGLRRARSPFQQRSISRAADRCMNLRLLRRQVDGCIRQVL